MLRNIFRTSLKFGVLGGLFVLLYSTILVRTEVIYMDGVGAYLGYIAIVIMPVCTFLAIRELNKNIFQYKITFLQAMLAGILVSVAAASFYSGLKWVENSLFSDPYQERLIEEIRSEMEKEGALQELVEKRIMEIRNHYNSWQPVINTFIWYISLGVLYSGATFLILKFFNKQN